MRCPCSVMQLTPSPHYTAIWEVIDSSHPPGATALSTVACARPAHCSRLGDLPLSSPSRPLGLFGVV